MDKQLEEVLCRRYPKLFSEMGKSPQESCMAWGCAVNNGWFNLIEDTCWKIVHVDPDAVFDQVKEKFGTLRLYLRGNDKAHALATEAEAKSSAICEDCGQPAVATANHYHTMCDECAAGHCKECGK